MRSEIGIFHVASPQVTLHNNQEVFTFLDNNHSIFTSFLNKIHKVMSPKKIYESCKICAFNFRANCTYLFLSLAHLSLLPSYKFWEPSGDYLWPQSENSFWTLSFNNSTTIGGKRTYKFPIDRIYLKMFRVTLYAEYKFDFCKMF